MNISTRHARFRSVGMSVSWSAFLRIDSAVYSSNLPVIWSLRKSSISMSIGFLIISSIVLVLTLLSYACLFEGDYCLKLLE